jgi:hypothetical protein
MRSRLGLLLISFFILAFRRSEPDLQTLKKGEFISIRVEKALYKKERSDTMYVHFLIKNRTGKPVGIDLKNQYDIISSHLCGLWKTPQRTKIRELRSKYWAQPINDSEKVALKMAFKAGTITIIEPEKEFSYYSTITPPSRYYEGKGDYLIVTCDGHLLVTNGSEVEDVTLHDASENTKKRDVVMEKPVAIKALPVSSYILNN